MKIQQYLSVFKIPDLRKKILFILFIFGLFRLMANIPIPGVRRENISTLFRQFSAFGFLNLFTGGALERISIVMLGLGPYITAIIILQLLTLIFPSLEKMYKEGGREGREKFEQYGRILTFPLAFFQGWGMIQLFIRQGILPPLSLLETFSSVLAICTGTMFLMWLGELISERGLGNGVSLLIFAGIAADFPKNTGEMIASFKTSQIFSYILFFVIALLIIYLVVLVNEAKRQIPISYAKRVRGTKLFGGVSTYLPLSINPAGVIPIIFAISFLTFPQTIAQFLSGYGGIAGRVSKAFISLFENFTFYTILYFLLVFLFTFFYTMIVFDPKSLSENLQKFGGFIPGIRPGRNTAQYISFVLFRILLFGALFLAFIAIMPNIMRALTRITTFGFLVGGTSLLILVSVILETIKQLRAELEMREYDNV